MGKLKIKKPTKPTKKAVIKKSTPKAKTIESLYIKINATVKELSTQKDAHIKIAHFLKNIKYDNPTNIVQMLEKNHINLNSIVEALKIINIHPTSITGALLRSKSADIANIVECLKNNGFNHISVAEGLKVQSNLNDKGIARYLNLGGYSYQQIIDALYKNHYSFKDIRESLEHINYPKNKVDALINVYKEKNNL